MLLERLEISVSAWMISLLWASLRTVLCRGSQWCISEEGAVFLLMTLSPGPWWGGNLNNGHQWEGELQHSEVGEVLSPHGEAFKLQTQRLMFRERGEFQFKGSRTGPLQMVLYKGNCRLQYQLYWSGCHSTLLLMPQAGGAMTINSLMFKGGAVGENNNCYRPLKSSSISFWWL